MKCASCGRESEYSVCGRCLAEKVKVVEIPSVIEILACSRCGRYKLDKWRRVGLSDAVSHNLSKTVSFHEDFWIESVEFHPVGDEIGRYRIEVSGKLRDYAYSHSDSFEVRVKKIACKKCSMQAGGYYEAVIQIRADKREISDNELESILGLIYRETEREDTNPKAFISKLVEKKEGVDVYIGDKKLAQKITRQLTKIFGAELKESISIAGREDGRDLYRFTYLVRLPHYQKGDVVKDGEAIALVLNAEKKKAVDVYSGKGINLKSPSVIAKRDRLKTTYVLNVDRDVMEILDPESYESISVKKPDFDFQPGDAVYVAKGGDDVVVIHRSLVDK